MAAVLLTIQTLVVLVMVAVILLQRSEGGALGIGGGGGGGGGFMTGRGAANVLTRTTTILGAFFFISSFGLALLAKGAVDVASSDIIIDGQGGIEQPNDSLEDLLPSIDAAPAVPALDDLVSDIEVPVAPATQNTPENSSEDDPEN